MNVVLKINRGGGDFVNAEKKYSNDDIVYPGTVTYSEAGKIATYKFPLNSPIKTERFKKQVDPPETWKRYVDYEKYIKNGRVGEPEFDKNGATDNLFIFEPFHGLVPHNPPDGAPGEGVRPGQGLGARRARAVGGSKKSKKQSKRRSKGGKKQKKQSKSRKQRR